MFRSIIFLLILLPLHGFSQCSVSLGEDVLQCNGNPVTLIPIANGTDAPDSLRITYNSALGVSGLAGASTVYFHSGIQTVPFGGWEYVIGNWGADDGIGLMTAIGNNMWQITIHVDSYYGYPGGTNVIGLWMVFRNADGTATGKNDNNEDIFLHTSNNNTSVFSGVTGTNVAGSQGTYSWSTNEQTENITVIQTGTYSVTFTDGIGCVSTDDIYVEFGSGNVQVDLGPDQSLCDGETIILDAGPGFASYEWSTSETSQTLEVGLPGDYAVTVTDQAGCTGIDLIHIEVGTSPTADFSYTAVTGTTVSFTDLGSDADIIYWDFDGDGLADDSCAAGGTVLYEFPAASVFGVEMTAVNACGEDISTQNVLVQDVGIENIQSLIGFTMYPNPTTDQLTIAIQDASTIIECISVMDLNGKELYQNSASNQNRHQMDMNELPVGVYVLRVVTSIGIINERIIKQGS